MAYSISLNQPQVFQCQNCREFINTSMTLCTYCGVTINASAAAAAADIQTSVANACSEASFLKIMARAQVAFFVFSLIPLIGGFAGWGFLFLLIAVPVMLIRWWVKYRNLQTGDKDYEKAKRNTIIAAVIWSAGVVVWLVISALQVLVLIGAASVR